MRRERDRVAKEIEHSGGYVQARDHFEWNVPDYFNIGIDVCDRWALHDPDRPAIIEFDGSNSYVTSFEALRLRSNRLANLLVGYGLKPGDRVGVLASQRVDTAAAHIAIYKCGAIAVPLFSLFGQDALRHRLVDSETSFLIADEGGFRTTATIRDELPKLAVVIPMDPVDELVGLDTLLQGMSEDFKPVPTRAEDPALIIYTSGTTGASKGALHAHRVLLGHLPGVEMSHDEFPKPGDRMWTPADWAWIGGLLDVLLPALHHGVAVVAHRFAKFTAEAAFELIACCCVRNVFLPPTALKMMRLVPDPAKRWPLELRTVASGGETLGSELLEWGRQALGVTINEFYGQTECNMVLSSCSAWFEPRAGAIGRPVPGHTVGIIGRDGELVAPNELGEISVRRPDPVMFLGYWRNQKATSEKFRGEWLLTGDLGSVDDEGFFRFLGRVDDVITSAGYRIGPGEIEDCILRHPAVEAVGVAGVPDPTRTEIVVAFVVLRQEPDDRDALAAELQELVRSRLGAHQYPRRVCFLDSLPLTTTGKVMRRKLRALALKTQAG